MSSPSQAEIGMEVAFAKSRISERARLFCASAVNHIQVELDVRSLQATRVGLIVLLVDDVLYLCLKWLNEHVMLNEKQMNCFKKHEMYRYLAVLLFSHCTGFSFGKTMEILSDCGCSPLAPGRIRFISSHILAFSATDRGQGGSKSWNSQRDKTPFLTQFEHTAFRVSCKLFLSPNHTFGTLDDDLYGTRAKDNQVKSLSARKADKEGHTAHAIADAIFRVNLMVRFSRRGGGAN